MFFIIILCLLVWGESFFWQIQADKNRLNWLFSAFLLLLSSIIAIGHVGFKTQLLGITLLFAFGLFRNRKLTSQITKKCFEESINKDLLLSASVLALFIGLRAICQWDFEYNTFRHFYTDDYLYSMIMNGMIAHKVEFSFYQLDRYLSIGEGLPSIYHFPELWLFAQLGQIANTSYTVTLQIFGLPILLWLLFVVVYRSQLTKSNNRLTAFSIGIIIALFPILLASDQLIGEKLKLWMLTASKSFSQSSLVGGMKVSMMLLFGIFAVEALKKDKPKELAVLSAMGLLINGLLLPLLAVLNLIMLSKHKWGYLKESLFTHLISIACLCFVFYGKQSPIGDSSPIAFDFFSVHPKILDDLNTFLFYLFKNYIKTITYNIWLPALIFLLLSFGQIKNKVVRFSLIVAAASPIILQFKSLLIPFVVSTVIALSLVFWTNKNSLQRQYIFITIVLSPIIYILVSIVFYRTYDANQFWMITVPLMIKLAFISILLQNNWVKQKYLTLGIALFLFQDLAQIWWSDAKQLEIKSPFSNGQNESIASQLSANPRIACIYDVWSYKHIYNDQPWLSLLDNNKSVYGHPIVLASLSSITKDSVKAYYADVLLANDPLVQFNTKNSAKPLSANTLAFLRKYQFNYLLADDSMLNSQFYYLKPIIDHKVAQGQRDPKYSLYKLK
jgi:hypothetical protein